MQLTLLRPFSALLVIASFMVISACFTPVAHAELYDMYSCKSCAAENGTEGSNLDEIFWNQASVEGAKGVCSAIWRNEGGGKWHEYLSCTSIGGYTETEVHAYITGHGQVRRYYKEYLYNLSGFEEERP